MFFKKRGYFGKKGDFFEKKGIVFFTAGQLKKIKNKDAVQIQSGWPRYNQSGKISCDFIRMYHIVINRSH